MATDATGTPTSPDSIPTYNVNVDAPSGLGFNAAMEAIQDVFDLHVDKPASIASGEVPVWNGSAWVRSSVTKIGVGNIADLAIANAQVATAAAIARSKLEDISLHAYRSAALTVNNTTDTKVAFDAEAYDPAGMHNTGTGTITIPSTGLYAISMQSGVGYNGAGYRQISLRQNGGGAFKIISKAADQVTATQMETTFLVRLTASDTLELYTWQNSGGGLGLNTGQWESYLMVRKVAG